MRSAPATSTPPSSCRAWRAPALYAKPTIPPAPRTSPTLARRGPGAAGTALLAGVSGRQVLRHRPAEDDEAVPPSLVKRLEQGDDIGVDRLGLGRFKIEHAAGRAVARHHEAAVVDAAL